MDAALALSTLRIMLCCFMYVILYVYVSCFVVNDIMFQIVTFHHMNLLCSSQVVAVLIAHRIRCTSCCHDNESNHNNSIYCHAAQQCR